MSKIINVEGFILFFGLLGGLLIEKFVSHFDRIVIYKSIAVILMIIYLLVLALSKSKSFISIQPENKRSFSLVVKFLMSLEANREQKIYLFVVTFLMASALFFVGILSGPTLLYFIGAYK
jgi:hypothetical protein